MKKFSLLMMIIICLFTISCYRTNTNGSLFDVTIYDLNNEKIEGSWEEWDLSAFYSGIMKLNSPAPILENYFVNVYGQEGLIICFDILLEDKYEIEKIETGLFVINKEDFINIEYEKGHAYCYYKINNISDYGKNYVYMDVKTIRLYNKISNKSVNGSSYYQSRMIHDGICFSLLANYSKAITMINAHEDLKYKLSAVYTKEELEVLNASYDEENNEYIINDEEIYYYLKQFNDDYIIHKVYGDVDLLTIFYIDHNYNKTSVRNRLEYYEFTLKEFDIDEKYDVFELDDLKLTVYYKFKNDNNFAEFIEIVA